MEVRSVNNSSQKSEREGKAGVGGGFKESIFCLLV